MQITRIGQGLTQTHKPNEPHKQNFTARPQDVLKLLDEASNVCFLRKTKVKNVTDFFANLEQHPLFNDTFTYKLNGTNTIPPELARIDINGTNLEKINEELVNTETKAGCGSRKCSTFKNMAEFVKDTYEKIGAKFPDYITISKK